MTVAYSGLGFLIALHKECAKNIHDSNAWICFAGADFDEVHICTTQSKIKRTTKFLGHVNPDNIRHQLKNYRFEELEATRAGWKHYRLIDSAGVRFSLNCDPKVIKVNRIRRTRVASDDKSTSRPKTGRKRRRTNKPVSEDEEDTSDASSVASSSSSTSSESSSSDEDEKDPEFKVRRGPVTPTRSVAPRAAAAAARKRTKLSVVPAATYRIVRIPGHPNLGKRVAVAPSPAIQSTEHTNHSQLVLELQEENERLRSLIQQWTQRIQLAKSIHGNASRPSLLWSGAPVSRPTTTTTTTLGDRVDESVYEAEASRSLSLS
jgi:hypothetical protein